MWSIQVLAVVRKRVVVAVGGVIAPEVVAVSTVTTDVEAVAVSAKTDQNAR